ncbi:MAG: FtsW/RodA/SpoVE family cell cycle protein, partial [Candidatus Nealsonbacteria bacterium]|nr:FtsW/RodA/SpoVE family cell cycle protein [Candidatus Nealsonbacteria bacterium]
ALVFIPGIGVVSGGALRWLNVGFTTVQPSEILKLSFIIYLATWLDSKLKEKKQFHDSKKTFIPFICILGFIFVLFYLQSNASTLILIFSIALSMYFLSSTPLWQSMFLGLGGAFGAAFLILFEPYRLNRLMVSLGIIKDPMGLGYQINQSLISIGSGGFFGNGLGSSSQKLGSFLPQTMSDSIFSVFAEELGFIGAMMVLSLFIVIFIRCIRIGQKTEDKFSQLFVIGFGSWICLQAFINIGAMIQLIPLTGIPLPFISYGGSHIIMELIGAGVVLNISKNT